MYTFVTNSNNNNNNNKLMSIEELKKLEDSLDRGDKVLLAKRLRCAPSKITNAFSGFVKSEMFLTRLSNEIQHLLDEKQPASA